MGLRIPPKREILQIVARLVLGGVFIYASIDKIAFPAEFANIIKSYNILPIFLIKPIAIFLPWVELIFGIFLIIGLFIKESAIILTSLLFIFLIAFGIQSTKGPIEDCGCFGSLPILSTSNQFAIITRDLTFLFMGILIFIFNKSNKNRI